MRRRAPTLVPIVDSLCVGTYLLLSEWEAFALSVPVGLLASALLVVNNVRDSDTDRRVGKKTLAVRLGRDRTRVLYASMLGVAFLTVLVSP